MRRTAALLVALFTSVPVAAQAPPEPQPTTPKIQAPDESSRPFEIGLWVGPGIDLVHTTSGDASTAWVPRLSLRFPAREGLSPTVGFGWFDTNLEGTQFGGEREIGELQIRPIMVGARYTWVRDAWSYDVAATIGMSFSDFDLDGDVARSLGAPDPIRAEADTSLATKLQGGVWYDYTDRVAFRATVGVFRCTPEITVTANGVARRFEQSANAIQLGVSVVYRVF